MTALFVSWIGDEVAEVARLRTRAGKDLHAIAEKILDVKRMEGDHRRPDRCTIYVARDGKLELAGEETPKWHCTNRAN